ncbi:MAG: zinc-dependent metalloprotease family protein [Planctomycetota bacterium]|jgi:hypothetical protein|nr:zinc-dependent metalloprotease family protein [Planctomycetota bacterium]
MALTLSLISTMALACPASAQSIDHDRVPQLFAATLNAPLVAASSEDASIRKRLVEIDIDQLTTATEYLSLNLFADIELVAKFDRLEQAYGGGTVWVGSIIGSEAESAIFSVMGNAVAGSITWDGQLCQVDFGGNGTHWINLVDTAAMPRCGTDASHAVTSAPGESQVNGAGGRAGNPDIDVMVVYSTAAKNAVGGTNAMQSRINLAITESNSAYNFSGVTQELVLVHTEEMIGYTEPSSFSQILTDLRTTNDGDMDNVHALRDQYAADCVSMICRNGQYCGIAYLMTNPSPGFQSSAFSVCNYSCMTGYYSFSHELGHNMGSNHDPQNASSGAYSYSFGYRTSNNAYRTVMAYSPGTRVMRFSGPSVTYGGYTMGNSSQDNARSLNNTAPIVADWRDGGTGGGPGGPTMNVPTLTAGQYAIFSMDDCTPNSVAYIYYSTTGGVGPTSTAYGMADLTAPLSTLPFLNVDNNGYGSVAVRVPSRGAGVTAWFQGVDVSTAEWSSSYQTTVQ